MSVLFVGTCVSVTCSVCLHACGSVSVCLWKKEGKCEVGQTGCLGIYVIHAKHVLCCWADSRPSLDSVAREGLHRPDLNAK